MFYDQRDTSALRRLNQSNNNSTVRNYDANFSEFLHKIHAADFSDDFANLGTLQEKLKHIKKESANKYLDDLMYPEAAMHSKIPNTVPFPTASFKMHETYTITPNNKGNFVFTWNPFFLTEAVNTSFCLNIDNSLDGTATSNLFNGVAIGQQIPVIYTEYRLVSAALVVQPKNSVLNMQGTLSGACIIDPMIPQGNPGFINPNCQQYGNFTYTDDAYYNQVVSAKDGLRCLYFPLDISFEQFQPISNIKTGFNFLVYGQGLQASQPCIRVDFYMNFEATPSASYMQYIPRSIATYCAPEDKSKAVQQVQEKSVAKWDGVLVNPNKVNSKVDITREVDKLGVTADKVGQFLDLMNNVAQLNAKANQSQASWIGKEGKTVSMDIEPSFTPSKWIDNDDRATNLAANAINSMFSFTKGK